VIPAEICQLLGILVDTGPLVAILSIRDRNHRACVEQLKGLEAPLITCWPVLTEAAWLLRSQARHIARLLPGSKVGLFRMAVLDEDTLPRAARFIRRHAKFGAQLAGACLVYLAERDGIETIFTLDRRDFSDYRFRGDRRFKVIPRP
jgi:predicted nucleic acid-binding protein